MNNIDILEEFIKEVKETIKIYKGDIIIPEDIPIKSIENLIAENKELKKKNKSMNKIKDELNQYKKKEKEKEELIKEIGKDGISRKEAISILSIASLTMYADYRVIAMMVAVKELEYDTEKIEYMNKAIDMMAEQLSGLTIFDKDIDSPLILGDKEEVKKYYAKKLTQS